LDACCSYKPEARPDLAVVLDILEQVEKEIRNNPFY
jgi:hypothetical protein